MATIEERPHGDDMNVLFIGVARTIWLFELALLNPTGMSLRGVVEELGKRYHFAKVPKNEFDFDDQNSLGYKSGTFTGKRNVPLSVGLGIYKDGLVAETVSSTDESTEFLIDVSNWLDTTYGLVIPKQKTVAYLSQIDFQMDAPMSGLNSHLASFAELIEDKVTLKKSQLQFASLAFWTEEFGRPGTPAAIKIERKIPAPFERNHYFSQAPMTTKDHISTLNEFEALLISGEK